MGFNSEAVIPLWSDKDRNQNSSSECWGQRALKERKGKTYGKTSIGEEERWRWPQDFHRNMLATMCKSKIFLASISFMTIVPQKMSDNSEEATKQLEAMKNVIFPISKE